MKFACKAIRAVTVEFCGVFLVAWLLVNFGSLGLRTVGVLESQAQASPPPDVPTLLEYGRNDRLSMVSYHLSASPRGAFAPLRRMY